MIDHRMEAIIHAFPISDDAKELRIECDCWKTFRPRYESFTFILQPLDT